MTSGSGKLGKMLGTSKLGTRALSQKEQAAESQAGGLESMNRLGKRSQNFFQTSLKAVLMAQTESWEVGSKPVQPWLVICMFATGNEAAATRTSALHEDLLTMQVELA